MRVACKYAFIKLRFVFAEKFQHSRRDDLPQRRVHCNIRLFLHRFQILRRYFFLTSCLVKYDYKWSNTFFELQCPFAIWYRRMRMNIFFPIHRNSIVRQSKAFLKISDFYSVFSVNNDSTKTNCVAFEYVLQIEYSLLNKRFSKCI